MGAPIPAGDCAGSELTNVVDAELVCFDADPSPLVRISVYDPGTGDLVAGPFWRDPATGAVAVPGGDVIPCSDAGYDSEIETLCDVQDDDSIVSFLRLYVYDADGNLVTTDDTELDGITAYAVTGTVYDCGVAAVLFGSGQQSGFGGPPVITRVTQAGATTGTGAPYTTDSDARRITIIWQGNSAALGNRVTIAIDGGAAVPLVNEAGTVIIGDLVSVDVLGFTVTITVNQPADDVTVIEEF